MSDTDTKRTSRPHLTVIPGDRVQRELEAVAALVDPRRFGIAGALLSRLESRGRLQSVLAPNSQEAARIR